MNNPTLYVCAECANEDCESSGTNSTCLNCGGFVAKKRKQTNADRIRSMTDDELAEFCVELTECYNSFDGGEWADWLKQEVDDG